MIQRRVAIVAVVVVVAAALSLLIRPPMKEPALSHELIAMQRAYESQSVNFIGGGPGRSFSISDLPENLQGQVAKARDIDQENTDRLRPLLERFGWPTKKMVGREAVQAALNVVQRASDAAFKEFAIGLMQKAGADDNAGYARLVDQVAVVKGEPQTYGTQWTCEDGVARPVTPVKETDPSKAMKLRRRVGLGPYDKFAREFCFRGLEQSSDGDAPPVPVTVETVPR